MDGIKTAEEIARGLENFKGVKRRFELVEEAVNSGARDNVTAIVIYAGKGGAGENGK